MIKWFNTPFEDVIQSATNIYGELNCEIGFNPKLHCEEEAYGVTQWCEDGTVVVQLDADTSITHLIEILAHELAHVIIGKDEEHTEKWEKAFDNIFKEYNRYCKEKYNE